MQEACPPSGMENGRAAAHIAGMDDPTIRLYPAENRSGETAVWKWEILLKGKQVASGTSSGSQESAYTDAREALLKYRKGKSRRGCKAPQTLLGTPR